MERVVINIKGAKFHNYNRKDDSFNLSLILDVDGKEETVTKGYMADKKITGEFIFQELIREINKKYKKIVDSDNPLDQTVIVIRNTDRVEEKFYSFIKRVNDRIRDFKSYKSHYDYMKVYGSMIGDEVVAEFS